MLECVLKLSCFLAERLQTYASGPKIRCAQSIRLSLHHENQHYPILFVWIVRCDVTRFKGNDDQDLDLPCDGNPTALNHIQTNEKVMYACQR